MTPASPPQPSFTCSICEEKSQRICTWCTKDACDNHICAECARCSDCCVCDAIRARQREGN